MRISFFALCNLADATAGRQEGSADDEYPGANVPQTNEIELELRGIAEIITWRKPYCAQREIGDDEDTAKPHTANAKPSQ